MLLTALKEFADRNQELPDFYARQEVRYRIDLDAAGNQVSFEPLVDDERPKRGVTLPIPYLKPTSGIVPLPVNRGDYVLGVPATKKTEHDQRKADARAPLVHAAYLAFMAEAAEQTKLPALTSMLRFAKQYRPESDHRPEGFDASRFVAIYVDGVLVTQDPVFQRWWATRQRGSTPGEAVASAATACAVCGKPCSPVESVPVGIRGLTAIGGKAIMTLVSGNEKAFERHGLTRAAGASLCLECGRASHQALNQLIADSSHAKRLGSSMFVWWATEDTDDWIAALLAGDTDEAVRATLDSVVSGRAQPSFDGSRFYGVSLGANTSRVVVKSWLDTTLSEAQERIGEWFARTRVVDRNGSFGPRPGLCRLLESLAPPGQGDALSRIDPRLPTDMLESALAGRPLPPTVLTQTLARLRAEQGAVTPLRAALLKACLTPVAHPRPEDHMTGLDISTTDPAYLCGRVLALLDDAARLATAAKNSLVNRSYSSLSTMPAITLTRLLRLHRAHLDKLERDKPGAAHRIDSTIAEILSQLDANGLPRTFSVTEQGRFALGLYHQQAAGRAARTAAQAAKTPPPATPADSPDPASTIETTTHTDEELSI